MIGDLSVRLTKAQDPDDGWLFDLHTFDPDYDEDGCAIDCGVPIIQDGIVVGDGTRDGYANEKIAHLASLIEHAPQLLVVVEAIARGAVSDQHRLNAQRLVADIDRGYLKYRPEW